MVEGNLTFSYFAYEENSVMRAADEMLVKQLFNINDDNFFLLLYPVCCSQAGSWRSSR